MHLMAKATSFCSHATLSLLPLRCSKICFQICWEFPAEHCQCQPKYTFSTALYFQSVYHRMLLWKNHHFTFQHLTFNSKDQYTLLIQKKIVTLIQIHMTHTCKPEWSQTDTQTWKNTSLCFLVDLWPWPSIHYSCCVILECNNKYKL